MPLGHAMRCTRQDDHTTPGACVVFPERHTLSCTRTDAHDFPRECRFTLNDDKRVKRA